MTNSGSTDLNLRRPFTRADAAAAGITGAMLRGSRFRRIFRDVYAHEHAKANPFVRVEAALRIHPPDAYASHVSAARLYRLPIPGIPEEHISVRWPADRRRRPGLVNHVVAERVEVASAHGMRVSAPAQMFVELAALLGLIDLVVVGDALVRLGLADPGGLVAFCAQSRSRGVLKARRAAAYVRRQVESPMESRLRMLIVLAGLPEPVVNHKVYNRHGRLLYRFDLSYPELMMLVEYDGRQHRANLDQWDHDIARREWFDHNGWMVVPVVARGMFRRPDQTIERVRAALELRGCQNLPRHLSDAWRPYFPVRP